jgi:hypothetical protein
MSWESVRAAILAPAGSEAIALGRDPSELAPLLDKVRRHAYRITEADVSGIDVDRLYEAVLAAAFGPPTRSGDVRTRRSMHVELRHSPEMAARVAELQARDGYVSDISLALRYRPELFGEPFSEYLQEVMKGPSEWSEAERELFAAFVSALNQCPF